MRRSSMLALLLALPLSAQDADPTPPDGKRIQGTWGVVRGTKDGKPAPRELLDGKLTFDGEMISIKRAVGTGEPPVKYKLDPKTKPSSIDVTPPAGPAGGDQTVRGIYRFDKDELTLVFGSPGQERPTKFDDEKANVMVLRREKAKK